MSGRIFMLAVSLPLGIGFFSGLLGFVAGITLMYMPSGSKAKTVLDWLSARLDDITAICLAIAILVVALWGLVYWLLAIVETVRGGKDA